MKHRNKYGYGYTKFEKISYVYEKEVTFNAKILNV